MEDLRLVADLGSFTTVDRAYDEDTGFLTLGGIYGMYDDIDIDIWLRYGLSDPLTDTTLLLDIAFRF